MNDVVDPVVKDEDYDNDKNSEEDLSDTSGSRSGSSNSSEMSVTRRNSDLDAGMSEKVNK